jgi:DNA-binding transcriptional LysR family regulator
LLKLGLTLLPRWDVARQLADGSLVQLLPGWAATVSDFDGAAWLLYPSRAFLPAKVRAFVDWVKREFRDGPPAEVATSPTHGHTPANHSYPRSSQ